MAKHCIVRMWRIGPQIIIEMSRRKSVLDVSDADLMDVSALCRPKVHRLASTSTLEAEYGSFVDL